MSERRCPNCDALVAADAEWCPQCFHALVDRAPPPPADAVGETGAEGSGAPIPPPPPGAVPRPGSTPSPGGPSSEGTPQEGPTWTCPSCGTPNTIERDACAVCGTPFLALFRSADARPDVAPRSAITRSLLFPGLGHAALGRSGEGAARGALFVWTLGMVVLILLGRGDRSLGPLVGIVALFLVVAAVLYVATAVEAGRIADGGAPFLSPRGVAWVAAGLVIATLVLAFVLISGSSGARTVDQDDAPIVDPVAPSPTPTVVVPVPSPTATSLPGSTPSLSPGGPSSTIDVPAAASVRHDAVRMPLR